MAPRPGRHQRYRDRPRHGLRQGARRRHGAAMAPGMVGRFQGVDRDPTLALPAVAGEVILIHNHTWHRSRRNATHPPRPAPSTAPSPETGPASAATLVVGIDELHPSVGERSADTL